MKNLIMIRELRNSEYGTHEVVRAYITGMLMLHREVGFHVLHRCRRVP